MLLEPTTGLEPVTSSLPRKCSTTELCGRKTGHGAIFRALSIHFCASWRVSKSSLCLERVMGIEPTSSAWKAEVLPLNYTRLGCHSLINLPPPFVVEGVGFEPTKA